LVDRRGASHRVSTESQQIAVKLAGSLAG